MKRIEMVSVGNLPYFFIFLLFNFCKCFIKNCALSMMDNQILIFKQLQSQNNIHML